MKFYLQGVVVRGKQLQIPVHSDWGGFVECNISWRGNEKDNPGKMLAQEIAKILREHGYEWEHESRGQKRQRIMLEKREVRRASMCEHANENPNVCPCESRVCYCKTRTCKMKTIDDGEGMGG